MLKSKTLWASCAAILGAVSSFFLEEITAAEMAQIAIPAVLAIFLRHGIHKTQNVAEAAVEAASSVTPAPKKRIVKKKV